MFQYPLSKLESSAVYFRASETSFSPLIDHLDLDSLSCCQKVAVYVVPMPVNEAGGTHENICGVPHCLSKPLPLSAFWGAQIHDSFIYHIYLLSAYDVLGDI